MRDDNGNNAEITRLESHVAALEELLQVQEETVRQQADELTNVNHTLEQRVEERTKDLLAEIDMRKTAQTELQASRTFFQTVIDAIPELTTVIAPDYRILHANRAARAQCGGEDPVRCGMTCHQLSHHRNSPCEGTEHPCPLKQVLATKSPVAAEHTHFDQNGNETTVEIIAAPVFDEAGQVVQVVEACRDITDRKRDERELADLNMRLIDGSRRAGMAEVATGVLHNVGNVLNSVNVSGQILTDKVKRSRITGLAKANDLIEQHADDLATFFTDNEKGELLPPYLRALSEQLLGERDSVLEELGVLLENIEHIKEIVNVQQSFAKVAGVLECVDLADVVDSAVKVNDAGLHRHRVDLKREYKAIPSITTDRHKIMQILVNLISNAKYALSDSGRDEKRMTIRINSSGENRVKVEVEDNGAGIACENLSQIFQHGFTTKKDGHGFGLHSSALAAKELGGTLSVHSDGPGTGATFTLELPLDRAENATLVQMEQPALPAVQPVC